MFFTLIFVMGITIIFIKVLRAFVSSRVCKIYTSETKHETVKWNKEENFFLMMMLCWRRWRWKWRRFERSWRHIETSSKSLMTRDVAETASCFCSWDRPFNFFFSSYCWSLWQCHELLTPCFVPFVFENASRFNFCSRCSLFLSSMGPASSGDGIMPKSLRCRRDKNTRKLIHNLDFLKSLSVGFHAF